jgi:endogenous inhibitor of DNA gyrase (YacG/DUF329 family)
MKVKIIIMGDLIIFICPKCKLELISEDKCPRCGTRIDWDPENS